MRHINCLKRFSKSISPLPNNAGLTFELEKQRGSAMLKHIHFLLTYACNYECDHCFLYCGPHASGTFTIEQIVRVLDEAKKIGTVEWIYFEGGEPFLYFPIMVEGLRLAKQAGFRTGVVTNCYWATGEADAALWLKPMATAGIDDLCLSNDDFHFENPTRSPATLAGRAAAAVGIGAGSICIEKPGVEPPAGTRGAPVVRGGALFKGRAADTLTGGLPTRPRETFTRCTHEELVSPGRVHVDPYGHVMPCQGISLGNMWQQPLSEIMGEYKAAGHPICGPLEKGGPTALAQVYDIDPYGEFVDECHYCFAVRRQLVDRFPHLLGPRQLYGLDTGRKIAD
jgi:Radical SAM superfamily